jgi:TfoX/Sxy family transcriptional regulator of competence genes
MAWKKVPAELVALLDEAVAGFDAQRRSMFGCPCYFTGDQLFIGAHQDSLMLRLSEADRQAFLQEFDEAEHFEPLPGRPMREYLLVPEHLAADLPQFRQWIERSHRYARSLPPKQRKKAAGKKAAAKKTAGKKTTGKKAAAKKTVGKKTAGKKISRKR